MYEWSPFYWEILRGMGLENSRTQTYKEVLLYNSCYKHILVKELKKESEKKKKWSGNFLRAQI